MGGEVLTSGYFSPTRVCVFWDVEDFPVPVGGELHLLCDNLRGALRDSTYRRAPFIKAYSAVQTRDENDQYRAAKIPIEYQEDDKRKRLCKMLLDIDYWARTQPTSDSDMGENSKVVVVAKDVPDEDSLFVPLLSELDDMNYDISLVVPDPGQPLSEKLLSIPPLYLWTWEALFSGGSPIEDEDYYGTSD